MTSTLVVFSFFGWGHELRYKSKAQPSNESVASTHEKLRRSPEGIRLLVESLGGSWGRTAAENRCYFFEQAIYQEQQRADESNDSYIARHDTFFDELISRSVEEVRAHVLLRHSLLQSEDKKRVILESSGELKYQEIVKAICLVGARISEFEDQIIDALQDNELANVYTAYQEARQRLREKARARGYWPSKGRGNTKGQHGKEGKGDPRRRRTLAERTASSSCKICGEREHWKRECPRKEASNNSLRPRSMRRR